MGDRNWGLITNGATFEALVATLVAFEDPSAVLFGRRGKDGGQDSRSGDGKTVYQAKHHEDGAAAKAIADAKKEAAKISEYRKVGNARFEQWKDVTHWRLVTNAAFNPTDHQTWIDDVAPRFAALGLKAEYWERANVNALLDKHPEVDRSFFGNEPRAFLTLPEVRERLLQEELFVRRVPTSFVGRDVELAEITAFIRSDKSFLVVHGAGGMGKSRLLVESGSAAVADGWQVLWANVATIASGVSWFDAIVPERSTVLLVDEPETEEVLRLLTEQVGGRVGRSAKWKVIVAVRSPKDPVLKFLASPKLKARIQWLPLEALSNDAAEEMCRELLAGGPLAASPVEWKNDVASKLAKWFSRQPIWLTLAVHVLEVHKDLTKVPTTAAALADLYLEEVIGQQGGEPPGRVLSLLRWIALVGTVNRESGTVRVISDGAGIGDPDETLASIARLVERRALRQRGANRRLVELKPDVLRDHLLQNWLVHDVGFGSQPLRPSDAAQKLVRDCVDAISKGGLGGAGLAILTSIGRTELLFRMDNRPVPLLAPFFEQVHTRLETFPASVRIALVETLVEIAPFRPVDVVSISRSLRTSPIETETIKSPFGAREVTNDAVLLELGWAVFHAAMGARDLDDRVAVLEELCELTEVEAAIEARRPGGLPNDGRRSSSLVGRTLEGGPTFWSDFDDAVGALSLRRLERLQTGVPTKNQTATLRALIVPAVAVEREQTLFDENTFTIRRFVILPGHPGWDTRRKILERIKALLSDDSISAETHIVLWGLLVEGHRHANFVALHGPPEFKELMHAEFLDDLRWTEALLGRRGARIDEMKAARDLWEWHSEHEKNADIKAAADSLERLYTTDALAAEFEPLLMFDTTEAFERRARAKASELAAADDGAIDAFVERGEQYVDENRRSYALNGVANELGALAFTMPRAAEFVTRTLSTASSRLKVNLAVIAANRWAYEARKQAGEASMLELVKAQLAACADDDTRIRLLVEVYGCNPPRLKSADLVPQEHAFLRSKSSLFRASNRSAWFVGLVSWTLEYEWTEYKTLIEAELDALAEPSLTEAVAMLVQGIFWATYKRTQKEFPEDAGGWFLDQLIRVQSFGFGSNLEYRIDEVLGVLKPPAITWLPTALKKRASMEATQGYARAKALSRDMVLGDYVQAIDEAHKDDPAVEAAVSELLDLADDKGSVGYRMPEVLHSIDPNGFVVAKELAKRITAGGPDAARHLGRLARAYVINTAGWRTVATAVLELAPSLAPEERRSLYSVLGNSRVQSWNGLPGQVPVVFQHAFEAAQGFRDKEADTRLIPYWEWNLGLIEADLRRQEEEAKEERGE